MKISILTLLSTLSFLLLSGCGGGCVPYVAPGIVLNIYDEGASSSNNCGSKITVYSASGGIVEEVDLVGEACIKNQNLSLILGATGSYTVVVSKSGYPGPASNLVTIKNSNTGCTVETVNMDIRLKK
jgi:hypothetical protein